MAAPNLNAIASAFLRQVQVLENAINDVIVSRVLGHARGAQLDILGRIVGEDRLGREDDDYTAAIRLRIFINSSSGTPEEIMYIARQLSGFPNVGYLDITPGNIRLVIPDWIPDEGQLLAKLQKCVGGGVRILGINNSYNFRPFHMGDHVNQGLLIEA